MGNASVSGDEAAAYTAWKVARQCSCFSHRCRVFAPKYRQARVANYHCFEDAAAPDGPRVPSYQWRLYGAPAGARAFDVAYEDVRTALSAFLERKPRGRPWFVAGHSRGATRDAIVFNVTSTCRGRPSPGH